MPLSEHEQRLLDEMERSLYQNDADFVSTVSSSRGRINYRSLVIGIIIALVGIAVIITGVVIKQPFVGIIGFVVVFGGALLALAPAKNSAPAAADDPRMSPRSTAPASGFMDRMNDRWDRRHEGGER